MDITEKLEAEKNNLYYAEKLKELYPYNTVSVDINKNPLVLVSISLNVGFCNLKREYTDLAMVRLNCDEDNLFRDLFWQMTTQLEHIVDNYIYKELEKDNEHESRFYGGWYKKDYELIEKK